MFLKKIKSLGVIFFTFFFIICPSQDVLAKKTKKKAKKSRSTYSRGVSCQSAILSNSTEMRRLYGKDVYKKVYPASTTKVMTALVVLERLNLDDYVTVSKTATLPQPSKIYVQPGEQYKVKDLLYAILMNSANDASVVLAEAVAGSEANFVRLMNARAKQLGAKYTRFANSHGLPSAKGTQYTTAYDMYLIFKQALKHEFFKEAIKLSYKNITSSTGKKVYLKSHNKILFYDWRKKVYGKTGYTKAAGACFVGTVKDKRGNDLIVGVFNCTRRWDDIKHLVAKYGGVSL